MLDIKFTSAAFFFNESDKEYCVTWIAHPENKNQGRFYVTIKEIYENEKQKDVCKPAWQNHLPTINNSHQLLMLALD